MKQTLILFFISVSFLISCIAKEEDQLSGEILNYGVVEVKELTDLYETKKSPGRNSGFVSEPYISERTLDIPLKLNTGFGIEWKISGISRKKATITYEVLHPPIKLPGGETSDGIKEELTALVQNGSISSIDGYYFGEDYELVPGEYIIQIKYKNLILKTVFNVQ